MHRKSFRTIDDGAAFAECAMNYRGIGVSIDFDDIHGSNGVNESQLPFVYTNLTEQFRETADSLPPTTSGAMTVELSELGVIRDL